MDKDPTRGCTMTGISVILAGALQRDLLARGSRFSLADCEAMVARMFGCAHSIERRTQASHPPRRCETDGNCEACGAIQG